MLMNCKKHGLTEHYEYQRKTCKKCNCEAVIKRRKEIKVKAIAYKGGKCEKCGLKDSCPDIYDFHHIDESKKEFGISHKGHSRSWERVKVELDKCLLLCANCHRREHYYTNQESLFK